jgi:probable F420-dependent oxidoreductase
MSKLSIGPIGIALNVSADDSHLKQAAELEELGYSTIWLPGGQIDRLDRLAAVIEATASVPVGSAIIPVDRYEPGAVAELRARVPGRFIAGLGGPQQPRPMAALNDWLDRLDRLDRAQPPGPAAARILAALGPRKLELAAARAAGAIALLVTPAYTAWARGILGEQSTLVINQMVVLDTDAARARETALRPLRFLSSVAGYRAAFARMGFATADIDALSDRLVDELVTWGSAGDIGDRVSAHLEAGADQVALTVLSGDGQPGLVPAARLLADALPG